MTLGVRLFSAAFVFLGATVAANASTFTVTIEQVGSDVVATGSGTIDLAGLVAFPYCRPCAVSTPGVAPLYSLVTMNTGPGDLYTFASGNNPFGTSTGEIDASTSSGDVVSIYEGNELFVPAGYVSGSALSDTMTFDDATIASLGLTPGTYTFTWGSGADAGSFVIDIATTPLPAALPLFASALGALGFFGLRKKRGLALAAA